MSPDERLYVDHNATSPLTEVARRVMVAALDAGPANPSSPHSDGRRAAERLIEARRAVASFAGAKPSQTLFFGSATEALNTVIAGVSGHLLVAATEHPAVLEAARSRASVAGVTLDVVPVDSDGRVHPDAVAERLREDTQLVCVMRANNETGVVNDLPAIARVLGSRETRPLLLCDAVQSARWEAPSRSLLGADVVVFSSHKLGGPVGAAALIADRGVVHPLLHGGGQERGLRPGTENVAAIQGFAAALGAVDFTAAERTAAQRERLEAALVARGATIHGRGAPRLPNTVNFRFDGVDADGLLLELDARGVSASSGSACSTGSRDPSHVLLAMGARPVDAWSAVRFSVGPDPTPEWVDALIDRLDAALSAARKS